MSDCTRRCGATPASFDDIISLVEEDRAEIVPFRHVGETALAAAEKSLAAAGWLVQVSLVEHNTDDVVIKVAARHALNEPTGDNVRTLLRVVQGTPWHPAVQFCLANWPSLTPTLFLRASDEQLGQEIGRSTDA